MSKEIEKEVEVEEKLEKQPKTQSLQPKEQKVFSSKDVEDMVKERLANLEKELGIKYSQLFDEKMGNAQKEFEEKYSNLKEKYVSEESKKKLEEEERREKAERQEAEREATLKSEKEKLEKERLEVEIQKQSFLRLEVADELEVPKHLRKYINGKSKDEMLESAKAILDDMVETKDTFEKAVQEAVEKKFADDATGFKKSSKPSKLTVEQFQKMSIDEKIDVITARKEEYNRMMEEKRQQES